MMTFCCLCEMMQVMRELPPEEVTWFRHCESARQLRLQVRRLGLDDDDFPRRSNLRLLPCASWHADSWLSWVILADWRLSRSVSVAWKIDPPSPRPPIRSLSLLQ